MELDAEFGTRHLVAVLGVDLLLSALELWKLSLKFSLKCLGKIG